MKLQKRVSLRPESQRQRIKSQEVPKICLNQLDSIEAKPNSLVFQSEIASLQNYFSFLQAKFGKEKKVSKFIKRVPSGQRIHEEYDRMQIRKTWMDQHVKQGENLQYIKIKFNTTRQMNVDGKSDPYRNGVKHSLIKMPVNQLKIKSYQSKRKKHSYLMQRMNYPPKKMSGSPIFNKNPRSKSENQEFWPMGDCVRKVPNKTLFPSKPKSKLSEQLMKGITYKRSQNVTVFVKKSSENRNARHPTTEKIDQGPWNIYDTTDYNHSLYSAYY